MKVLVDINILLDVFQKREPFYEESSKVITELFRLDFPIVTPGHSVTTIYYIVAKQADVANALELVDWMLGKLDIGAITQDVLKRSRNLEMKDYEDAVCAAVAEQEQCQYIVTRDLSDFSMSPVSAVSPDTFIKLLNLPQ